MGAVVGLAAVSRDRPVLEHVFRARRHAHQHYLCHSSHPFCCDGMADRVFDLAVVYDRRHQWR